MEPGQAVGDYVLQKLLGQGREGEVWLGHHRDSESKPLAIKVCRWLPRNDEIGAERAQRIAAQGLEHPHIVRQRDFFFHDGQPVFVMDYIEGESLADRIDARGPLPIDEVRQTARRILDALDYAHRCGVTHRDVKPSNILLDRSGQAHLADFGIALTAGQRRLTAEGTTMGTPEYMSPEQLKGIRNSTPHLSDEYSFGCVLYEMLTGRPPFGSRDGDTISDYELMTRHANVPLSLEALRRVADERTVSAVARALEKQPEDRFGGCREMGVALGLFEPTSNPPPPPPIKLKPWLAPALGGLALLLLAGSAWQAGWFDPFFPPTTTTVPPTTTTVPPTAWRVELLDYVNNTPDPKGDWLFELGQRAAGAGDLETALFAFEEAMKRGSGPALQSIGRWYDPAHYSAGSSPFSKPNPEQAALYYKRAIDAGVSDAEADLRTLCASQDGSEPWVGQVCPASQ